MQLIKIVNSEFIVRDAVKKDEELEIRQAEKKLYTSIVTINNNVVPAENPPTAAKALSREQVMRLRQSRKAEAGVVDTDARHHQSDLRPHSPHAEHPLGAAGHQAGQKHGGPVVCSCPCSGRFSLKTLGSWWRAGTGTP